VAENAVVLIDEREISATNNLCPLLEQIERTKTGRSSRNGW
jgi:hypothetical protein